MLPAATVRATLVRGRTIVVEPEPVLPELVTVLGDEALELLPEAAAGVLDPWVAAAGAPVEAEAPSDDEDDDGADVEPEDPEAAGEPVLDAPAAEPLLVLCVPVALGSADPVPDVIGGTVAPGAAGVVAPDGVELGGPGAVTPVTGVVVGVPVSPEPR